MSAATVTSKGQITIPAEVRQIWGLEAGDQLEFYADHLGHLCIRPRNASATAFLDAIPARKRVSRFASDDAALSAAVLSRNEAGHKKQSAA